MIVRTVDETFENEGSLSMLLLFEVASAWGFSRHHTMVPSWSS